MSGRKAVELEQHCRQSNRSFVRFDYRGHGESTGDFMDLTLTEWIQDALHVLDNVTSGPQVLVGSSMGAWIALHVALHRPNRVVGIVGIGAAPDFTRDIHEKLSKEEKVALNSEGVIYPPSLYSDEPYPITKKMLADAEKWYVMDKPSIGVKCHVHLIHGRDDRDVSFETSVKLGERLESTNVQVSIIENGNHRLSEPSDLEFIRSAVKDICKMTRRLELSPNRNSRAR
jgi:pimeloyl-ACP methyl ester carboxylesterase